MFMEIIKNINKWILQWLWILTVFVLSWVSYAAWTSLQDETTWTTITATKWNAIIDRLNSIDQKSIATAWVNFDWTTCTWWAGNECSIKDSYNILKVVKLATWQYVVYFTSNMDNVNYSISWIVAYNATYQWAIMTNDERVAIKSMWNFGLWVYTPGASGWADSKNIWIQVFWWKN